MKRLLPCLLAFACNPEVQPEPAPPPSPKPVATKAPPEAEAPGKEEIQAPVPAEAAPAASPRKELPAAERLTKAIGSWFEGRVGRRLHVQTDKPLYKPGETIWLKVWDLRTRDFSGQHGNQGFTVELVSPKGATVRRARIRAELGMGPADFELPDGVQGGEYTLRVTAFDGVREERPLVVSAYEPPRIKKKLEFVRKAYGAGDEVKATVSVKRPTGEPLGNHPLRAQIRLDGQDLPPVQATTNAEGGAIVRFTLPDQIELGDALLTVLVDDGGITESVSKRVPIVLKKLRLAFYPEGGQMVAGLPTRVYFEAKNLIGKPADISGRIVDDAGQPVAQFESWRDGLGRVAFTPATGRTYKAEITQPVGITEKYDLPLAESEGCALRTYDDLDGELPSLRVGVQCSSPRSVVVGAFLRERLVEAAAVDVPEGKPAVVELKGEDGALGTAIGVARVTLFDQDLNPLAERIVFRNRRARLDVKIEPSAATYVPRAQVALTVTTTDPSGRPVPAELGVSVVDDTVISFADDKTGHMLSRLLLEPELPGEVEEPNFYLDLKEKKSGLALELLMGTRGWRRFEWQPVLNPRPASTAQIATGAIGGGGALPMAAPEPEPMEEGEEAAEVERGPMPVPPPVMDALKKDDAKPVDAPAQAGAMPPPKPVEQPVAANREAEKREEAPRAKRVARARGRRRAQKPMAMDPFGGEAAGDVAADEDWAEADRVVDKKKRAAPAWAPVRVFPVPSYPLEYDGPRTDFRETIYWNPAVRTGPDGKATVTFPTSDAITSFRVFAEGAGRGHLGRAEQVIQSKLPFSMGVKLPLEVSQGDRLQLPLTLSNEVDRALPVSLSVSFGELLKLKNPGKVPTAKLAAGSRESLYYDLEVSGVQGESTVSFAANAGGLEDRFERTVRVVPLGFPQQAEAAGVLKKAATHAFDLGEAEDGTVTASVRVYPSPVATLLSGVEGLIREPHGCFEQTSATHYPNVMVLRYLQASDAAAPDLVGRVDKLVDRGYRRLVGFEAKQKGYEWFGRSPGHEALTAYGLAEFADMRGIYDVDEQMMARTVAWLKARRDGKGGFQRDGKALDSFGRASPEVTDAYIRYSIAKAGLADDFRAELDAQAKLGATTKDPYLLALAANTLLRLPAHRAAGLAAARRLAGMQGKGGAWTGADHSITRSGGINLTIETTALAVLALLESSKDDDALGVPVRAGLEWLQANRGGFGQWGATQATVLALEAMTTYAVAARQMKSPGRVEVVVNGKPVGSLEWAAGQRDPLEAKDLGVHFTKGKNTVELRYQGSAEVPYGIAVEYRSTRPATHPEVAVEIATRLEKPQVKMGENLRLVASVKNRTDAGQPMTVARVGLPGGLTFQTWQLKELRDNGLIAFYETRAREVVLYFDQLGPGEAKEIPLDLVATIPGSYTGPASSAWLYYTNDKRAWTPGLEFTVQR